MYLQFCHLVEGPKAAYSQVCRHSLGWTGSELGPNDDEVLPKFKKVNLNSSQHESNGRLPSFPFKTNVVT